jgi:hypothetical protein
MDSRRGDRSCVSERLCTTMTRKATPLCCALALTLLLCVSSEAALQVSARGGYGNYFRPGAWLPIIVTVENFPDAAKPQEKKDFRGTIEASVTPFSDAVWQFSRKVEVPVFSRKTFFLYARLNKPTTAVPFQLLDANNKVVIQDTVQGLTPLSPTQALLAIITTKVQALYFPDLTGIADQVRSVTINPDSLPDRWYGYESVSLAVLCGYDKNVMSARQEKALLDWVRSGGTLLVLGGVNTATYKGTAIEPLLPLAIRGTKTFRFPDSDADSSPSGASAQGEFLITDSDPVEGAQILYQHNDTILAASRRCGVGNIIFCAFDLTDERISRHPKMFTLWAAIFPFQALNDYDRLVTTAIGAQLEMGLGGAEVLPNLGIIGFVMLAYILLVGPANFLLLWRKKRLELAWITVPAIVAVFTVGILIVGYATKGSKYIYRECNLVRLRAGDSTGVVHSAIGFFSPRKSDFTIRPASKDATLSRIEMTANDRTWAFSALTGNYPYWYGARLSPGARNLGQFVALDNDQCSITGYAMEQWTVGIFETSAPIAASGSVDADVTFDGSKVQGRIVSRLPMPLHRAFIHFGGSGQAFDKTPVKPGEVLSVDFECTGGRRAISPFTFVPVLPEAAAASQESLTLRDINTRTAQTCLDILFSPSHWLAGMGPPALGSAYLLGWTEEPYARLNFGLKTKEASALTLYIMEIPIKLRPGKFSMAAQIPHCDIIGEGQSDIGSQRAGSNLNIMLMGDNSVTVASAIPCEPTNLTFGSIHVGLSTQGSTPRLYAYNLKKRQWNEVPLVGNVAKIFPPQDYAAPLNGRLFIRVAGPQAAATAVSPAPPRYDRLDISSVGISYTGTNSPEME